MTQTMTSKGIHQCMVPAHVLMTVALLMAGCSPSPDGSSGGPAVVASEIARPPLRIALIQDKSLSTGETRTPQMTLDDMQPLVELLGRNGGELAVSVISDRSNLSMARLRIEAGPQEPVALPPASNSLERLSQRNAFRRIKADFEKQRESWRDQMQDRIAAFQSVVEPILSMPAKAQHSPVWDAVRRADLFLCEPEAGSSSEPHRYVLLITDGIDDVSGKPVSVRRGTQILMVNGSGTMGSLGVLNPDRFESIASAVQYVVDTESKH